MRALCLYRLGFDADAAAACRSFIEHFPLSRWVREARFWLGEHEFNNGLYPVAESNFIAFAQAYSTDAIADQALLLAGLSAARQNDYVRAAELLGLMARTYPESGHIDEARFIQADALCTLGEFGAAIVILDEIINKYPNSPWIPAVWCRKGDCQFALAPDEPSRYQDALDAYGIAANNASASLDLRVQAGYKAGTCLERIGRPDEALGQYYAAVMVRYFEATAKGVPVPPGSEVWVSRATFDAAELLEARQDWAGVLDLLQRLADAGLPGTEQVRDRIEKIKTRRKEAPESSGG
jgi:tetratricopeptide (TPR) repeat protein